VFPGFEGRPSGRPSFVAGRLSDRGPIIAPPYDSGATCPPGRLTGPTSSTRSSASTRSSTATAALTALAGVKTGDQRVEALLDRHRPRLALGQALAAQIPSAHGRPSPRWVWLTGHPPSGRRCTSAMSDSSPGGSSPPGSCALRTPAARRAARRRTGRCSRRCRAPHVLRVRVSARRARNACQVRNSRASRASCRRRTWRSSRC
jgi:hypothetical protein